MDGQRFFRAMICVDTSIPLCRMVNLKYGGELISGLLSYERFPNLYFNYGMLDRLIKKCNKNPPTGDKRKDLKYGLWIKSFGEKSKILTRMSGSVILREKVPEDATKEVEVRDERVSVAVSGSIALFSKQLQLDKDVRDEPPRLRILQLS
ncbi:hypothetical protein LIER_43493 [Lithospermum erythrorhizon]|uniref:Uncharacterized protein n=1 Tax=Lithospermum erythrorhizon TaxID=34254 RepID=A0AAV3QA14_LITER